MAKRQLTRNLGFLNALMLGIGTMIGAGIFILPSIAAKEAGPAASISYLIGGLIAILTAISISELATGMPKAGGSYYFVNRSLGPFMGTITGIGMWMGLIFASAFYMIGFQYYLSDFIDVELDVGPMGTNAQWLIAIAMTAVLIIINLFGTKGAGGFQNMSVLLLLGILSLFIVWGSFNIDAGENLGDFSPRGWGSVAGLAGLLFIGFMGFEVVATVAEEIKDPEKNLWRAMIGSVVIVTIFYMVIIIVATGIVHYDTLGDENTPISYTAGRFMGPAALLITFAALLATVSSANASILSASRISFAMGKDRILHPWMTRLHEKFMTPFNSIALSGILILAFQASGEVEMLAEVASFMFLFTFFLIHACVAVLRRTEPDWYNPSFRSPLFPVVQIVGAGACIVLIAQMERLSQEMGIGMIAIAVVWYKVWSSRKSKVEGEVKKVLEGRVKPEDAQKVIHDGEERTRKILVPFTNLVYERTKIRIAAALATEKGTMVRLNVVTIPDQTPIESALPHIGVGSIRIMDEIKELDGHVRVDKEYRQIIAHSVPPTIVNLAKEEKCELILLGRYRTRLPITRIKETMANYVLHRAHTDIGVLSMNQESINKVKARQRRSARDGKAKAKKGDGGGTSPGAGKRGAVKAGTGRGELPHFRKIMVPYEDNQHTLMALEFASKIGAFEKAEVTLFRVSFKKDLEKNRETMDRIMKDFAGDEFKLEPKIVTGRSPAKEIIAASKDYDLIIMGASRKWVLNKFLFGSVPDRVMAGASCPVLFAKKWERWALSEMKGRV